MSYMEDQARILEGQRAQRVGDSERSVTVGDMKRALVDDSYAAGNDIRRGLEIRGDAAPVPAPMEQVDPGWSEFIDHTEAVEAVNENAWEIASAMGEETALQQAINTVREAEHDQDWVDDFDDGEVLGAAVSVLATAPDRAGEFFEEIAERLGDTYAGQVLHTAQNTLAQLGANASEHEFRDVMATSEMLNVEHAQGTIDALSHVNGLTPQQFEMVANAFHEATGTPLRSALLSVMPNDRAMFLQELRIQHETDERATRERMFKASLLYGNSTDISSGLRINGRPVNDEVPPSITDPAYARWRTEQSVRREVAERVTKPTEVEDADSIKRGLLSQEYSGRWEDGLTDERGRRTSVREISERDPDSIVNQQQRQRERDAWKLSNLTGGRLQR